jgi:hypothetical protein
VLFAFWTKLIVTISSPIGLLKWTVSLSERCLADSERSILCLIDYSIRRNKRLGKDIQSVPGGNFNILGGHSVGHSKQKEVNMYICPIPNCFRDRAISQYSSLGLAPNIVLLFRMWIGVKRQLAVVTADSDIVRVLWNKCGICWYGNIPSIHVLRSALMLAVEF